MVYTEYFADGTQPTSYCELHASHGFFGTIVSAFAGEKSAPPPSIQDTGLLPSTATGGADPVLPAVSTEPPKKKRGFWSRLFGVGKDERSRR